MKYSLLFPYLKRAGQLHNTLISFRKFYKRNDYEVVLMEDFKNITDSNEHSALIQVLENFKDINIRHLQDFTTGTYGPAIVYNRAAEQALGTFLIITSPECVHMVDILSGLDKEFEINQDSYVVCSCMYRLQCSLFINDLNELGGSDSMWYQHSIHNNRCLNFCTSLSKNNWNKIGGFDPEFAYGKNYDDDAFLLKIKQIKLPIITRDDLLTVHVHHDRIPEYADLNLRNQKLLSERGIYGV
jgi:hypothetical protein